MEKLSSMPETRRAWGLAKRNFRRLLLQMIISWAVRVTPTDDDETLVVFHHLLRATERDQDRDELKKVASRA